MKVALAAFVKTPGLSPIKTRLASGSSPAEALAFYRLAIGALEATLTAAAHEGMAPYWAVAEAGAMDDPLWDAFPRIAQGEGGLGERLATVYNTLQARYGAVMLLGADAPQLDLPRLLEAAHWIERPGRIALGTATDGGFYLFGGSMPIGREVWTSVTYSTDHTATELLTRVSGLGPLLTLPSLTDVDQAQDLASLADELAASRGPRGPAYEALARWLSTHGPAHPTAPQTPPTPVERQNQV
jgi:glycosyltransferase A (GT-A) superfamily protein (DUF2064 family)